MELELVAWLREHLPQNDLVVVGPGDDAAVLRPSPGSEIVVTTDMLMDGVDFRLGECDLQSVGRKSLAVNLSDLAAMAARPTAAFVSLAIPCAMTLDEVKTIYAGMIALASEYELAIAGGDTNLWDGPLCINVTAMGAVASVRAWRRQAQPGDWLLVTGALGGSILGRHFTFEPRIREALLLAERYQIRGAMDISDGLGLDLHRLCAASGCGAEVELARIPIAPAARELANFDGTSALDHALGDGEDFELLLAAAPEEAERLLNDQPLPVPIACLGRFVEQPDVVAIADSGERFLLEPRGYVHRKNIE